MSTTQATATPAAQGGDDQVTGSIITLITNAQVRYEGILLAIDRKERSMHLKEVRSFGSEGRRPELGEIPAHDSI
jgi:protein LSM14